ncbi:MAG: hypothetical protein ABI681_07310 [Gemmatimonadales bacterium]
MILVCGAVINAGPLLAQRSTSVEQIGVTRGDIDGRGLSANAGPGTALDGRRNAVTIRLVSGLAGTLVGFVVGGFVGYRVLPHDCGGCDDPGLDAIVYGALVGTWVGAAAGVAMPGLGSVCSFNERVGRALLGAGAGGALGFLIGGGFGMSGTSLILVPLFSIGGAVGSIGRCWK